MKRIAAFSEKADPIHSAERVRLQHSGDAHLLAPRASRLWALDLLVVQHRTPAQLCCPRRS